MTRRFEAIASTDDFLPVIEAYDSLVQEYEEVAPLLAEGKLRGRKLDDVARQIPGLSEWTYARWSDAKAIIELLELREVRALQAARKALTYRNEKALSDRQIELFAKADEAVLDIGEMLVRFRLVLNRWEGVSRGVERLHFQLGNLTTIRKASIEDLTI